ncbi:MAG TPA: GNAT family N-acetyltransferase [Desulfosporosinus sp.]
MSKYYIRRMALEEIKALYKRIERDFARGEYSPFAILEEHLENGLQKAYVFCEEEEDLAYAVCTDTHDNGYVLISLLAVFKEYRGQGVGSAFLERLRLMYKDKQALLVEVERPDEAKTPEEAHSRRRRIEFYVKAGFYLIEGVDYSIWDIPMHLMAFPLIASKKTINQEIKGSMYELYLSLMGEELIHKMQVSG